MTVTTWDDFPGPRHGDEMMVAHDGAPSLEWQSQHNGAGVPEPDLGLDDHDKYAPGGPC